jgi:hypothetical protein
MNIIGLSGLAGSGKDTAAAVLVERFGFVKISLADRIKRICADVFGWGPGRLWGPSEQRNAPDPDLGGLTARKALQHLGTEWGRAMYENIWVNRALGDARLVLNGADYSAEFGVHDYGGALLSVPGVVIPDVRFPNEVAAIHAVGGRVWLIARPGAGLEGAAGAHASETGIDSLKVDGTIRNDRSLEDFQETVEVFAEIAGFKQVLR